MGFRNSTVKRRLNEMVQDLHSVSHDERAYNLNLRLYMDEARAYGFRGTTKDDFETYLDNETGSIRQRSVAGMRLDFYRHVWERLNQADAYIVSQESGEVVEDIPRESKIGLYKKVVEESGLGISSDDPEQIRKIIARDIEHFGGVEILDPKYKSVQPAHPNGNKARASPEPTSTEAGDHDPAPAIDVDGAVTAPASSSGDAGPIISQADGSQAAAVAAADPIVGPEPQGTQAVMGEDILIEAADPIVGSKPSIDIPNITRDVVDAVTEPPAGPRPGFTPTQPSDVQGPPESTSSRLMRSLRVATGRSEGSEPEPARTGGIYIQGEGSPPQIPAEPEGSASGGTQADGQSPPRPKRKIHYPLEDHGDRPQQNTLDKKTLDRWKAVQEGKPLKSGGRMGYYLAAGLLLAGTIAAGYIGYKNIDNIGEYIAKSRKSEYSEKTETLSVKPDYEEKTPKAAPEPESRQVDPQVTDAREELERMFREWAEGKDEGFRRDLGDVEGFLGNMTERIITEETGYIKVELEEIKKYLESERQSAEDDPFAHAKPEAETGEGKALPLPSIPEPKIEKQEVPEPAIAYNTPAPRKSSFSDAGGYVDRLLAHQETQIEYVGGLAAAGNERARELYRKRKADYMKRMEMMQISIGRRLEIEKARNPWLANGEKK